MGPGGMAEIQPEGGREDLTPPGTQLEAQLAEASIQPPSLLGAPVRVAKDQKPEDTIRVNALTKLAEMDEKLRASGAYPGTLNLAASSPTSLSDLGAKLLTEDLAVDVTESFADALCAIADGHVRNFPQNLFADFDYLAGEIVAGARRSNGAGAAFVRNISTKVVGLLDLYGGASEIRFQYVHDFLYGFDWAKWVALDPAARSGVPPFGEEFLDHMQRRGEELHRLAASNDSRFPKIPGNQFRNAFGFRREPHNETTLFLDLAKQGLIPVEAWRSDATPSWQKPYVRLREERARALGLL